MASLRQTRAVGAIVALVLLLLLGTPGSARALSSQDSADVVSAENYLNDIKMLKARFLQVSPTGDTVGGTIYLSRPGKLRLEYDPPSPMLVIADGTFLIYYDKQLKQTSYLGLSSSPAGILVQAHVKLDGGELKVVGVAHAPGVLNITVVKPDDRDQGRITLVFTEAPFALKQWRVVDQQGQTTTVSLFDAQRDVTLDKDLFYFQDPRFTGEPDLSTKDR
jgi:outer membrane lipoprotein-sorting protein